MDSEGGGLPSNLFAFLTKHDRCKEEVPVSDQHMRSNLEALAVTSQAIK